MQARANGSRSFTMRDVVVYPRELRAERAGEAVDRDTILNRCWGLDYFPESRVQSAEEISTTRRAQY